MSTKKKNIRIDRSVADIDDFEIIKSSKKDTEKDDEVENKKYKQRSESFDKYIFKPE